MPTSTKKYSMESLMTLLTKRSGRLSTARSARKTQRRIKFPSREQKDLLLTSANILLIQPQLVLTRCRPQHGTIHLSNLSTSQHRTGDPLTLGMVVIRQRTRQQLLGRQCQPFCRHRHHLLHLPLPERIHFIASSAVKRDTQPKLVPKTSKSNALYFLAMGKKFTKDFQ